MDERVVFAIKDYMYDLFEPGKNWPKYEFQKRSYARWALTEILQHIQKQPHRSSMEVIKDFVRKTDEYSDIAHVNSCDSVIFCVAHDVATDILDVLKAMN